jgi:uncharacterized membrane protein HdeD (DUF308 family)
MKQIHQQSDAVDQAHGQAKKKKTHFLNLKTKNWSAIACGVLLVALGHLLLTKGSLTVAPIALVLGYCVLIPVGIMLK